jgi:hypothetical protein
LALKIKRQSQKITFVMVNGVKIRPDLAHQKTRINLLGKLTWEKWWPYHLEKMIANFAINGLAA